MKRIIKRTLIVGAAIVLAAQLAPGKAFAAGVSISCRNTGGVCTITMTHSVRGTVSLDVSSTGPATPKGAPWEISGPGGRLCSGYTPADGVVRSYICTNVAAGTIRGGIFAGGGSYMQVGLRY